MRDPNRMALALLAIAFLSLPVVAEQDPPQVVIDCDAGASLQKAVDYLGHQEFHLVLLLPDAEGIRRFLDRPTGPFA